MVVSAFTFAAFIIFIINIISGNFRLTFHQISVE